MMVNDFLQDKQGVQFPDVAQLPVFAQTLSFINTPDRRRRMAEAEVHNNRPPLACVVRELERQPWIRGHMQNEDGLNTTRLRQVIGGVAIRIMMGDIGYVPARAKGSLGQRIPAKADDTTPGTYRNTDGSPSKWFARAERYAPTAQVFRAALIALLRDAAAAGCQSIEVRAGGLHASVGAYPGPNHRMPSCCSVLQSEMRNRDTVTEDSPASGQGASLAITYRLPRKASEARY